MDDDDDLFASLGGSLMKDLLADLNDESGSGGLLSLEELEQELAHLDDRGASQPPLLPTVPEIQGPNTAASLVVRAQEQSQSLAPLHPQDVTAGDRGSGGEAGVAAPLDAWSLSLEKFTAASLQDDFLQADSARKAQSAANQQAQAPPQQSPLLLNAEEYDVSEPLVVSSPPGLTTAGSNNAVSQSLVQQLTTKLETVAVVDGSTSDSAAVINEPPIPAPSKVPTTPQNSMTFNLPKPPPPTPQNSVTANIQSSSSNLSGSDVPVIQEDQEMVVPAPEKVPLAPTPPNSMHGTSGPALPPHMAGSPPPNAWNKQPPPSQPVPMPMPPPAAMQPPRTIIYSNPLPNARPIPASALASKFMSTRDVSYVVHSILKPVLTHQQLNAPSPFDYDRAFFQKAAGVPPAGPLTNNSARSNSGKQKPPLTVEKEMESRDKKAQDWSEKQKTLGHTAKTNVARPRALIAQPIKDKSDQDDDENKNNSEQRQRQALWKARIYCDQAYQAYAKVVETWHTAASHQAMTPVIASRLQPHLFKLLKCLGMVRNDQTQGDSSPETQAQAYTVVNETALPLLMKLPKGRNLLSRVLEQALLPPAAVSILLSGLFRAIYELPLPSSLQRTGSDHSAEAASATASAQFVEERLFVATARVLQTLPGLPGSEILASLDVVQMHSTAALSSPVRMQAVHALLQRGTQLAASDPSFAPTWKNREESFLKLLSGQ